MDIQGEIGHAHTAVRDEYQLPAVLSIVLVTIRVGVRAPLARGLWTEEESPLNPIDVRTILVSDNNRENCIVNKLRI